MVFTREHKIPKYSRQNPILEMGTKKIVTEFTIHNLVGVSVKPLFITAVSVIKCARFQKLYFIQLPHISFLC
jgi:hypothetical protein